MAITLAGYSRVMSNWDLNDGSSKHGLFVLNKSKLPVKENEQKNNFKLQCSSGFYWIKSCGKHCPI